MHAHAAKEWDVGVMHALCLSMLGCKRMGHWCMHWHAAKECDVGACTSILGLKEWDVDACTSWFLCAKQLLFFPDDWL